MKYSGHRGAKRADLALITATPPLAELRLRSAGPLRRAGVNTMPGSAHFGVADGPSFMKLLIVKPNVRGAKLPVWKFANAVAATAPRFAGASLDSIAAKYSIGRDALWRHMAKHVSEDLKAQYIVDVPVKELAARASAEGLSVLDYLAIVRGVLLQEFQLAAGVHDKHATASLAGRLTEVLREVGRITGEIMRSPAVQNINNSINITNSPIFIDLQQMLIKRLAGHPQALAAVIEGLRELESRSAPRPIAGPLIEHQGEAHAVA